MKGLDKDEYSTRFPLVPPVASSLVIAVITMLVGKLLNARFMTYQVPLWLALSLSLVALFIAGFTLHARRRDKFPKRNDQVFFILCAFTEERWIAGLIQDLHNSLDRRGLDLVLKVPERDYVHLGQVRHLRNLSERSGEYVGGIIMPAEPQLLRHSLKEFCTSAGYPVIFVDIDPFDGSEEYPTGAAFVGYAPEVIGCCAADYVGKHARRSQISSPSVLVIGSNKLHIGRQTGFVKQLGLQLQDAEFIIDESGDFSRARAREIVYENLRSGQHAIPNYIFCTSDGMALGAIDALSLMDLGNDGTVVVVGVDGIPEAKALIDSQKTSLRATVVQDSCRTAEIATDLLDKAIRGKRVEKCTYLEPQIYNRDR